ncbi:MAG: hypothetical protein H7282_01690 [Cytophagaceae bacterium]|nr:hypothetical protein [Cytophagaceae bacterium]
MKKQADKAPEVVAFLFYKVHFAFAKTKCITDYSKASLGELVGYWEHFSGFKMELISHADYLGSTDENLKIASDREKMVTDYVVSKGVAAVRLNHLSKE